MGNCAFCVGTSQKTIFLYGNKKYKDPFLEHVLGITPTNKTFYEYEYKKSAKRIRIQTCELGNGLDEVKEMHSKVADGVIYLSITDKIQRVEKPTLFVLMDQRSKQTTEDNLIVTSVLNGEYHDAREKFNLLLEKIDQYVAVPEADE